MPHLPDLLAHSTWVPVSDPAGEYSGMPGFRINSRAEKLIKLRDRKGLLYVEEKMETAIDRLSGKARNRSLRPYERVPAGTISISVSTIGSLK